MEIKTVSGKERGKEERKSSPPIIYTYLFPSPYRLHSLIPSIVKNVPQFHSLLSPILLLVVESERESKG